MPLPYPPSIPVPFARDAVSPYIHTVPVPSQVAITPGAASWTTGFVPLNMTLKTAGGIAPYGNDMNGVMNYLSANLTWLAAGGHFTFNADIVTYNTGYAIGAILRSASDPTRYYYNTVADNTNNPDSVITGWIAFSPLSNPVDRLIQAPAAGSYNNVVVGPNVGFLDIDTSAGNVTYTGLTAGSDGQIVVATNTGANLLTLAALNGGSLAANQLRMPSDLSFTLNDGMSLRYSAQVGKWTRM